MIERLALMLIVALPLFAQTDPYRPSSKLPVGELLLSLPSSQMAANGMWEIKFSHRFNQSLADGSVGDQLHSLFGLDTNADVNFGVSYAIRSDLQLSIARSNTNDTFEAAAKYIVLQQAAAVPVTFAARGGADIRTERDLEDRTTFFAQAIVSRRMGKVEVFALPTFATNAGRSVNGDTSGAMFEQAFNVPVGVTYFMRPALALVAEIIPPNGDLSGQTDGNFGWSVGIKRAIGGHWFELLLTNSQGTTVDQYVTSTFQGAGLDTSDVKLGFNIERRFGRRR
jgi:hypothetical protein